MVQLKGFTINPKKDSNFSPVKVYINLAALSPKISDIWRLNPIL